MQIPSPWASPQTKAPTQQTRAIGSAATGNSIEALQAAIRAQIDNTAPLLLNFSAQGQSGMWALSGFVEDEHAPGLLVTFRSNIPAVNGRVVRVGSNGWFSTAFSQQFGVSGVVCARCIDLFGEWSNEACVWVG